MKKTIFMAFAAALLAIVAVSVSAQDEGGIRNPYRYTRPNGKTYKINWRPETAKTYQRYTIAINPTQLFNRGLKLDFEYELPRLGQWLQIGLTGYYAPERTSPRSSFWSGGGYDAWGDDYDRSLPVSGWDDFRKMSGGGITVLYKKMLHRRGWYLSTGLSVSLFRVQYTGWGMVPFVEDGLTFYRQGEFPITQSFVKPSFEFNVGKHFNLTHRLFIDIYAGGRLTWSIYKPRKDEYGYQEYSEIYGFGYRGIEPFHGGVRFGVLLWNK